jgi:hypothetical protein
MSTEYDKVFIVEKPSSSDSEYVTHSPISYVVDSALNYRDFFYGSEDQIKVADSGSTDDQSSTVVDNGLIDDESSTASASAQTFSHFG